MARRQRALSFEEIEEQYQEPSKRQRVPIKVDSEDGSDLESSDEERINEEFCMTEISPRFKIEV